MKTLIILFTSLIFSTSVFAYSAKITLLQGDVEAGKDKLDKAKLGQSVEADETVKTGANSLAILTFEDGSILKLNAGSKLQVGASKSNAEVHLFAGSVFAKIAKQKTGQFHLKTQTVTMGVRGTQFYTSYGKTEKKGEDVWMCVNEGLVAVENPLEKEPVLVKQGEGIFAPAGQKVTPPKPYEWTKKLNWNMDVNKGDVVDHSSIESSYKDLKNQNYD